MLFWICFGVSAVSKRGKEAKDIKALFKHISVLLLAFFAWTYWRWASWWYHWFVYCPFSSPSPFLRSERAAFRAPAPATTPPNLWPHAMLQIFIARGSQGWTEWCATFWDGATCEVVNLIITSPLLILKEASFKWSRQNLASCLFIHVSMVVGATALWVFGLGATHVGGTGFLLEFCRILNHSIAFPYLKFNLS